MCALQWKNVSHFSGLRYLHLFILQQKIAFCFLVALSAMYWFFEVVTPSGGAQKKQGMAVENIPSS